MGCEEYREQFASLLTGNLDKTRQSFVENHLANCADCHTEFETAKQVWDLMGIIPQPEPSETMRENFDVMLSHYKAEFITVENPAGKLKNRLHEYWSTHAQPRLAFSLLLFVLGLLGGYVLHQPGQSAISSDRQMDSLSSQISDLKQVMLLSLLQDPSASQRIRAVSYTDEIGNVNLKVIDALFKTLNEDPNVNVRLVTLEALVKLSDEPKVREGLVRSINLQESPIMQSAIADVMVKLQERSSVQYLQKLLSKKDLNQMVKLNIENSIQKLI